MTDHITELGFEEPIDESPVETPDGWTGGRVVNTGGGIYCRIWRKGDLEVIYNLSNRGVGLQRVETDDQDITSDVELVLSLSPDSDGDIPHACAALGLMEYAEIRDDLL